MCVLCEHRWSRWLLCVSGVVVNFFSFFFLFFFFILFFVSLIWRVVLTLVFIVIISFFGENEHWKALHSEGSSLCIKDNSVMDESSVQHLISYQTDNWVVFYGSKTGESNFSERKHFNKNEGVHCFVVHCFGCCQTTRIFIQSTRKFRFIRSIPWIECTIER